MVLHETLACDMDVPVFHWLVTWTGHLVTSQCFVQMVEHLSKHITLRDDASFLLPEIFVKFE